jgi:hypothetical protein
MDMGFGLYKESSLTGVARKVVKYKLRVNGSTGGQKEQGGH